MLGSLPLEIKTNSEVDSGGGKIYVQVKNASGSWVPADMNASDTIDMPNLGSVESVDATVFADEIETNASASKTYTVRKHEGKLQ